MKENKLVFLARVYTKYKVEFADDYTQATIINPFCDENITVEYYEEDALTPFCVCFSFQHSHCTDEDDVVDWINEIICGKKCAIEFFVGERGCFGGDILVKDLQSLTYEVLEQYTGYFGVMKLVDLVDSFKVRGWAKENNFDCYFARERNGLLSIVKKPLYGNVDATANERRGKFMNYRKIVLGSIITAIIIGAFIVTAFFLTNKETVTIPVDGECAYIELSYHGNIDNSYIIDDNEECEKLLTMMRSISAKERGSTRGHSGCNYTLKVYQKGKEEPVVITLCGLDGDQKFTIWGHTAKDGYLSFFEADLTELLGYLHEKYPYEFWYDGNGKPLHRVNA